MASLSSARSNAFARAFVPSTRVVTLVAVALAAVCVVAAAGDADGELWWAPGFVLAPAVPAVWSALITLWRPDPFLRTILAALQRTLVVSLVAAALVACVNTVVVLLPPVAHRITTVMGPDGAHHYFATRDGSPWSITLLLGGTLSLGLALIAGTVVTVVVVMPWCAVRRRR